MNLLTTRAKEAMKTGLAMTLAYGIALKMGWENPHWAGFAVAMISLSTAGQSLNKGFMRLLGTVLGVIAAFILIALFPQQRWGLLLCLSVHVGICTYMLTGKRYQYAWFVAAFVCLIIAASSRSDPGLTFQVGMARLQETALGVLVYSLISAFLWKKSSAGQLNKTARELIAIQAQLFRIYRSYLNGEGNNRDSRKLRMQFAALARQFAQILIGAELDSHEVREVRHQWRRFQTLLSSFTEAIESGRQSRTESRQMGIATILPGWDTLANEVNKRMTEVDTMLAGKKSNMQPLPVSLEVDPAAVRSLSRFEKASVAVIKAQVEQIETLSRELFDCVTFIRGFKRQPTGGFKFLEVASGRGLDPARLQAVYRVLSVLVIAYLLWIYIDPPGHASYVQLAGTLAMAVALNPQAPPLSLAMPFAFGIIVTGILYVFVMPYLSSFAYLGLMIFGYTFTVYYLFWQPRQTLAKMGAIIAFLALTSIENQQHYDFATYANSSAMIMLAVFLVVAVFYLPPSPRPEKICLRLVKRFFRHCEFLIQRQALDWKKELGWLGRLELILYRNDLLDLPPKLAMWGGLIDHKMFPDPGAEQVQTMVNSLAILADRIKMLMQVRQLPQADIIAQALMEDIRAWRLSIQRIFQRWILGGATGTEGNELQVQLESSLNRLEKRINNLYSHETWDTLGDEENENFYRLLGTYRSLSEAVVAHARLAGELDWALWKEERF